MRATHFNKDYYEVDRSFRWESMADCRDSDPEAWFNEDSRNRKLDQKVRDICGSCAVRLDCLVAALEYEKSGEEVYGVWGGLSKQEREELNVDGELMEVAIAAIAKAESEDSSIGPSSFAV